MNKEAGLYLGGGLWASAKAWHNDKEIEGPLSSYSGQPAWNNGVASLAYSNFRVMPQVSDARAGYRDLT